MNTKLPNDKEMILKEFEKIFSLSSEEKTELDAQLLAYKFISIIEDKMDQNNLTRAQLAKLVGTSKSYITQLFRGDRTPNWKFLAKIQQVLDIEFFVCTKDYLNSIEKDAYTKARFKLSSYKEINEDYPKEILVA